MSEDVTIQPKIDAVTQAAAELRYLVADLQEIIDERPLPENRSLDSIKSRLISMEARLARLEVSLSALEPTQHWIQEDLQGLLTELSAAVEEMMAIRFEVHSLLDETNLRIM